MCYCCEACFENIPIKKFIRENKEFFGTCKYCGTNNTSLISLTTLKEYLCSCINKAYDDIDNGTGAMYDSEDKIYLGPYGEEAIRYSIREILMDVEMVFSYNTNSDLLIDEMFSTMEFEDADWDDLVVRNDLYGLDVTDFYINWELFKHTIKHYNRFFDVDGAGIRKVYLEEIDKYLYEYITDIDVGTIFYRVREQDDSIMNIFEIDPYKEMGPAPYNYSKTNRMSPAGISYLYVAEDRNTAFSECRLKDKKSVVAEFKTKEILQIIDFSKDVFYQPKSIFDDDYNHDERLINKFLNGFINEITMPVDENVEDHSYEYVATQVIAEYLRSKNYDGICFDSSVASGKSYVFFCGVDPKHTTNAYPYPFGDLYLSNMFPILIPFTEYFDISYIELVEVSNDETTKEVIETRML